nr:hypothetical protein [Tanacetum cinerariifolium]
SPSSRPEHKDDNPFSKIVFLTDRFQLI